jgi:branched-subunit amino acid transport protein
MLIFATLGILSWRYMGIILYKKIDPNSTVAKFVNAIAYGMTTAIVFKMIFFPNSAIKLIPFFERVIPFFLGILVFLIFPTKPNLALIIGIGSFAITIIFRNYM